MPSYENILPAGADTILTISSFGHMLYQARGLNQKVDPIHASIQTERTINGTLIDISSAQFRKYKSTISVPSEVYAPPLDGLWPGMQLTIDCAVTFVFVTGTPGLPGRPEVSGSSYTENGYTFYHPILTCLVMGFETHFDEWKNVVGWNLELEEV